MRPTGIFFKPHTPLIKFFGGKHPRPMVARPDASVQAHPLSGGLTPGGKGTLKISYFAALRNPKPVYKSIFDLPERFRPRFPSDLEAEQINSGGAELIY